ncbi:MAG: SEC-C domain-containing protein [Thioalkalivibrio sp.]|nr:SEC-C domain-containing protein [Thioalkalivibrio sp.]
MRVGRNDPCPCGSGRKYKSCHGAPSREVPAPAERTWRRLRAALDGFPTTMLRFAREVYGPDVLVRPIAPRA